MLIYNAVLEEMRRYLKEGGAEADSEEYTKWRLSQIKTTDITSAEFTVTTASVPVIGTSSGAGYGAGGDTAFAVADMV